MEARKLQIHNPLFPESRREFESMTASLASEACMSMTHSELEALIEKQVREVARKLLEEQLALREGGPAEATVVGEDGVERTHKRTRPRRLITTLGEVEVERIGYGQRGVDSRFPLDATLNLPPTSYSLGLRRKLAYEAAKGSFDDAVEAVELATGVGIPKRQAEEEVRRAAVDFDAFYAARKPAANEEAGDLLILSTDGKGVSMRRDALRPATRKAAEERRPRLEKRVSKGEKTATRRMAQVAAVYSIEPYVRTAEEIAGTLGPAAGKSPVEPSTRPKPGCQAGGVEAAELLDRPQGAEGAVPASQQLGDEGPGLIHGACRDPRGFPRPCHVPAASNQRRTRRLVAPGFTTRPEAGRARQQGRASSWAH
jgi:hypothetical protein